jgi:hypothetical protein
MSTRPESSSRRADAGTAALAVALGVVLVTNAWALLHVGFYERNQIVDTPVYQRYGDAIVGGEVPYRDFAVEYPPGALPVFLLPSFGPAEDYGALFEMVMWICAAATVAFVALAAVAADWGARRTIAALAFVALAPLALGSVVLTRYDFWPAALTAAALAALVAGRHRLGLAVLGLAVAAKLYPLVLLPPALVFVWRARGRREALTGAAAFAAVVVAVVLPFAVVAPDGIAESIRGQLGRPLQIETLGASVLLVADQLGLYEPEVVSSSGSQNLDGSFPDALALVQTMLAAAAVAAIWILVGVGRAGREAFLAASAATVTAFIAFGKVLSPQFLVWLLPLVPLVAGSFGVAACGVLAAALVTTQLWFPFRYWDVVALEGPVWLVFVRNAMLVALFGVLALATRRLSAASRSA